VETKKSSASLFGWGEKEKTKLSIVRLINNTSLSFNGHHQNHRTTPPAWTLDQWVHYVLTFDGQIVSVYIDGTLISQKGLNLNTGSSPFYLGSTQLLLNEGYNESIRGKLDECMVWKRALTEQEVRQLFIRQQPVDRRKASPTPNRRPKDTVAYQGHHYKLFLKPCSWSEARERCKKLGGYLACIKDQDENDFLQKLSQGLYVQVGGTDKEEEGDWRWESGEPFRYKNWNRKEPNNGGKIENYLTLANNGKWLDTNVMGGIGGNKMSGYICEWDK